ncbi:MAG: NAD(P)H-hydrate dehydratase [Bacteroidales bacterium]|nr:NAD(P)H-hydrate dehydratase [Bacteroidales bacterium]
MHILSSKQMHEADAYTIANEPIASIDLMERAAQKCYTYLCQKHNAAHYYIFCGKGNNGGDGLAIARMLTLAGKHVVVVILNFSNSASDDFITNKNRLAALKNPNCTIIEVIDFQQLELSHDAIIIDCIFGSGLNRPINGFTADYISYINSLENTTIAIDIPSGLFADVPTPDDAIALEADETLTFQSPKLQFLFAENQRFVGHLKIFDIRIQHPFADSETPYHFITQENIQLQARNIFGHKGTYGHALLVAGSYGKMGAATLAAKACLRTGCGLVTAHIPQRGYEIMQIAVPEAITSIDTNNEFCSHIIESTPYSAIGIGPGIGTNPITVNALQTFLQGNDKPTVLDADALNCIAQNPQLWQYIRPNTILTPHPGEFDRLTHNHTTCYERFETQKQLAKDHSCIVVLKGHYTSIATPDGNVFFNSTGNPGMATAGSGDVLTGIILSLLAQKYSPLEAAKIGVFLHGLAGDCAAEKIGTISIIASDIIENISSAVTKVAHI